jgi:hypothetical protein
LARRGILRVARACRTSGRPSVGHGAPIHDPLRQTPHGGLVPLPRAAVGGLRATGREERNTVRYHAHAGDVGIAVLADQPRCAHRWRREDVPTAGASHVRDAVAGRLSGRQGSAGGARRARSATGARRSSPAGPGTEGSRPWATRRGARCGQANARMLAHPVDAVINCARVTVVTVSVRGARRCRRWGWRRTRHALTRARGIVAAFSLDHKVGARATRRAGRDNHALSPARHGGALRRWCRQRRLRWWSDRHALALTRGIRGALPKSNGAQGSWRAWRDDA